MRKILFLVSSLALMSVLLLGCQFEESDTIDAHETVPIQQTGDINEKFEADGEISTVSISKSQTSNATVIDDEVSIQTLKSIISSAVKEHGIVNMANPEFYMNVVYENENNQSFHLWIGKKGEKSAFMKTGDTHIIYTISEKMTNKFMDILGQQL